MTRTLSPPDDDQPPTPPMRPDPDDCCNGSCHPCIFDVYDEALERYRGELQAWTARQAKAGRR